MNKITKDMNLSAAAALLLFCLGIVKPTFSQQLRFVPYPEATVQGGYYNQNEIGNNGIANFRQLAVGGLSCVVNFLEPDGLKTFPIGELSKKKLFTAGQIDGFKPVLINDKLYDVTLKGYKELILTGRDKESLALTEEVLPIWTGTKKLFNCQLESENDNYFALVDISALYENAKETVLTTLIVDKQDLKNVQSVAFDGSHSQLHRLMTDQGNFYSMSTPVDKRKMGGAIVVSEEIILEHFDGQTKHTVSYTYPNGGVVRGTNVYASDKSAFVNVILLDGDNGLKLSVLKLTDNELNEVSSMDLPYEMLYAGNETNAASTFRARIKEKKGALQLAYNAGAARAFNYKDGSYLDVIPVSMNKIPFTMMSKISSSGEIQWVKCIPTISVVHIGMDNSETLHIFMNDASSRYDGSGTFVSFSEASVTVKKSPVNIAIDAKGEIIRRAIMKDGFDKDECFDFQSSKHVIEHDGKVVLAKSTCANSATNTCPSMTYGVIDLNP